MKKLLLLALFSLVFTHLFAQDFPEKPAKLVSDYAGVLSASEKAALERKLVAFDDSTSTQIAVALIKSVGDYDIAEYAVELGRKWGVGQKGKNNGIIIVAAIGDRKVTIQTGYGVEGALPDIYAKRIREEDIKPNFKAGKYYAGLDQATTSIIKFTKGEYKNDKPKASGKKNGVSIFVIIIIIIIVILLIKRGGGGGQVIGARGAAEAIFWSSIFNGGGGGGSSWGDGGSSSDGDFGGFGGGSFGGGGSSGDW